MRVLGKNVVHEMAILDAVSGQEVVLRYRMPTLDERESYTQSLFERDSSEIKDKSDQANLHFGYTILEGFEDGSFGMETENGARPISCDPESEYYRADWKEYLRDEASDLIMFLAARIFRGHQQLLRQPGRFKYSSKN